MTRSAVALSCLVALLVPACTPAAAPVDAATEDAAVSIDAFVEVDAFAPPDAFVEVDAFVPPDTFVPSDAGPPASWDEVYAIFTSARCGGAVGCHYASTAGTLSLASSATACTQLHRAARTSSCTLDDRVVAGDPNASLLYRKLAGPLPTGCGDRMPDGTGRTPLTASELAVVARWIQHGAVCP